MMVEKKTLARPYAKAIVALAASKSDRLLWSNVLSLLVTIVRGHKIQALIKNKSLGRLALEKTLFDLCSDMLNPKAKNLIKVLIYHRRLALLPDIFELYEALCLESEQKIRLDYYTKNPLDSLEKEKVHQSLSRFFKKALVLEYHIDEHLLGGYRVQAGSMVIDASIAGYLDYLKGANV